MKQVFKYLLAGILFVSFINGAEASSIVALMPPTQLTPKLVTSVNCFSPPSGLVAWWPGESNAVDSIDGLNGTLMNGAGFAPGEVNTAFNLDGSDDFVLVNPTTNLTTALQNGFTFESWIKPGNIVHDINIFEYEDNLGGSGADGGMELTIRGSDSTLYANIVDTNQNSHIITSPTNLLVAGVWQHIALTYDRSSGVAAMYINGSSVTQINIGNIVPKTGANLLLGAKTLYNSVGSPANAFPGGLDELSFYSRALATNEITAIFFADAAGKCPEVPQSPYIVVTTPANQSVVEGGQVELSVEASGLGPLSYQWIFKAKNIVGATTDTLILTNIHPNQAGNYKVKVSNASGSVTSQPAIVTVTTQNILIYSYAGNEKNTAPGNETSYGFSGQMIIIPETLDITFIGWGTINGKKQYWITPGWGYLLFTVKGSQNRSYTILGKASSGYIYPPNGSGSYGNGYSANYLSSFIHRGQNANLTIGTGKTFSFPNTFTFNNTQIYSDSQSTNYVMLEAASNYSFLAGNTKTANDMGQTVADLISAQVKSLVKQGYQPQ